MTCLLLIVLIILVILAILAVIGVAALVWLILYVSGGLPKRFMENEEVG